ncbi:hypothetical protein [Stenotrophomonas maltophilia]|uniref:hypothetical protein n=3 Tax=Stenotrophomonas maltophilia TaxID=40324 RepID=UPI000B31BDB6|nr:hypothetical protein [Stenotrophomonas maltophilia]
MRKRSTGLLPFSAESGGERVICPDRAGLEKIEIGDPKGGKNGWIRCTARGMLIVGTFKGTSQIRETQAVQGVRALLKEVPLSPPSQIFPFKSVACKSFARALLGRHRDKLLLPARWLNSSGYEARSGGPGMDEARLQSGCATDPSSFDRPRTDRTTRNGDVEIGAA